MTDPAQSKPHDKGPTQRPADAWVSSDPLGQALDFLRMDGVFYCRSEFTEPWGLDLPPMPDCLMFHVVTEGRCVMLTSDPEPLELQEGVFTLVPHGEGHVVASSPGAEATNLFETERYHVTDRYERLVHGGGGTPCQMICGAVHMDHPVAERLVSLLPQTVRFDTSDPDRADTAQGILKVMASEVERPRPGSEAVIARLADTLVIQAIRTWIEDDPAAQTGWLAAIKDPQIGQALQSLHQDPERPWTVEDLAEEAAMSRSAFSARFSELVGETPMRYVRGWKMQVAAALLKSEGATVAELAFRLGYESEAAFSRAFKSVMKVSPGSIKSNS
ncbi:MAG: AraC family transcriptional regulator [Planctomycetota bacterium]